MTRVPDPNGTSAAHASLVETAPDSRPGLATSRRELVPQAIFRGISFSFAAYFIFTLVLPFALLAILVLLPFLVVGIIAVALPVFAVSRLLEARRRIRAELPDAPPCWDEDDPEPNRDGRCAACGRRLKLRQPINPDSGAVCRKCRSRFALMVGAPERSPLDPAFERFEMRRRRGLAPHAFCAACGAEQTRARTWRCDFCALPFCFACYEGHFLKRRHWHVQRLRNVARAAPAAHPGLV